MTLVLHYFPLSAGKLISNIGLGSYTKEPKQKKNTASPVALCSENAHLSTGSTQPRRLKTPNVNSSLGDGPILTDKVFKGNLCTCWAARAPRLTQNHSVTWREPCKIPVETSLDFIFQYKNWGHPMKSVQARFETRGRGLAELRNTLPQDAAEGKSPWTFKG